MGLQEDRAGLHYVEYVDEIDEGLFVVGLHGYDLIKVPMAHLQIPGTGRRSDLRGVASNVKEWKYNIV